MVHADPCSTVLRALLGIDAAGEFARQIDQIGRRVRVRRGETLETDSTIATLAFVADGATKLGALASRGRQQIVAFHFAGDIISIPPEGLHRHVLTALRDCSLALFPAQGFYDRAAVSPRVLRLLLERSQTALFRCRDKAVNLGQKTARERVAGFLLAMAERLDCRDHVPGCMDLPMSRRDIADSLGLTIETVSRQIGELKDAGIIETRGRSCVILHDAAELARQAGNVEPRAPASDAFITRDPRSGHALQPSRQGV